MNPQGCSQWWTNASSEVRRSMFMDDFVVSISDTAVQVRQLNQMDKPVAGLTLKP